MVGLSGLPPGWLGWRQFRALGAVALDLCAVAEGRLDGYVDCSPSAHGPWDYLGGMLVCQEAGAVVDDAVGRDLVVLDHGARRTPVAAGTRPCWPRRWPPGGPSPSDSYPGPMRRRIMRLLLGVYRRLPVLGRRWVVRTIAPSFTVGAMAIIERQDGAVLLVRHSYRRRWGVPGGLMKRGEHPEVGLRREVLEEVGIEVDLLGEPAVVVDPDPQRVDLVFRGRLRDETAEPRPVSPEIVEVGWFRPDELPELQFETSGALMALARASRNPQSPPLPSLGLLERHRREAG